MTDAVVQRNTATVAPEAMAWDRGIRRLVFIIDARARRPGSSLYLVSTHAGDGLAGNVGLLGEGVLEHTGWTETVYRRLDDPEGTEHRALVRVFELPSGFRLLVGRDLEERERDAHRPGDREGGERGQRGGIVDHAVDRGDGPQRRADRACGDGAHTHAPAGTTGR